MRVNWYHKHFVLGPNILGSYPFPAREQYVFSVKHQKFSQSEIPITTYNSSRVREEKNKILVFKRSREYKLQHVFIKVNLRYVL